MMLAVLVMTMFEGMLVVIKMVMMMVVVVVRLIDLMS